MRTTIRMDDQLFAELKKIAAEEGRTLAAVIEDALRESLARRERRSERAAFKVVTFMGGGLRPGIDPDKISEAAYLEEDEKYRKALEERS